MKILLVEDEISVYSFLMKGLEEQNMKVILAKDGLEAKIIAKQESFDLMILDVMIPRLNGLELCQEIRRHNKIVPILILSALGSLEDKVAGLELGADDYLVKPFHFKELIARIHALTRLKKVSETPIKKILEIGFLKLDPNSQRVTIAGNEVVLTSKEYSLLEFFLYNQNRILTRVEIAERVWGNHFDSGTNIVDVYVNYLRNKIEKGLEQKYIQTLIGRGYMFKNETD